LTELAPATLLQIRALQQATVTQEGLVLGYRCMWDIATSHAIEAHYNSTAAATEVLVQK
jgi:hypothetical protein